MNRPTPDRLFATLTAYQTSAALAAAIRLRLFTHVAAGRDTLGELARACGASERGLRALANHMVAHGFLEKQGEVYRCTSETAAFLDENAADYQGAMTAFLNDPGFMRCFDDLVGAVRRGGTVAPGGGTVAAENPVWVEFAKAMRANARAFAPRVVEAVGHGSVSGRVLDVAAGHGIYGIEFARRHPDCKVVFQDWESVLAVTRAHAQEAGLGTRASYLPGDALTVAFPGRFDAILVTNFLHHFGREECARFLAKCRSALAPGGRVAVLEFALSEDRLSPARSAAFDLVMVATTRSGEAYTLSEYDPMFEAAGLERPTRHPLPEGTHVVLVAGARRPLRRPERVD